MRVVVASLFLLLLLPFHSKGQKKIISNDSIVFVENTLKKVGKNVNFTIVPGPVYGVSQKVGLVVLPMIVYDLNKKDKLSPPSSSAVLFYFDFYGSWIAAVKQSLYWNQNKWRAFASFGGGNLRLKFFGIGRDTTVINNDDSNYVWSDLKAIDLNLTCYRKIYRGLYGGLEYRYNITDMKGDDSLATAKLQAEDVPLGRLDESVLAPVFVWDNRDNVFWSVKGYYATLNIQVANRLIMSSRDYGIFSGSVNGYHSLLGNRSDLTLAWHFYVQGSWGELPYLRYASYGQGDEVTGYTRGKYVDRGEVALQAELRYEIWKFISCGGYAGTGKMFSSLGIFGQSVWLHYGGARLYLNIIPSRNIRLRLDIAVARKDWGFYIGIGQGF